MKYHRYASASKRSGPVSPASDTQPRDLKKRWRKTMKNKKAKMTINNYKREKKKKLNSNY